MRKHSGAKVSLFAFQDIITATTGILILITLILTFFLNADAEKGDSDDLATVEEKLKRIEEEITKTQDQIAEYNRILKELGNVDPKQLVEEVKQLQATLAQLKVEIDNLGEEQKEALELAARLNLEQEKAKKLLADIKSIEEKIAELKRKAKEAAASNLLFPNISRALLGKKLMLVVMAKGKYQIVEYGLGSPVKKSFSSMFTFTKFLEGKSGPLAYQVVFFIKPSGIKDFRDLHGLKAAMGEPSKLNLMGYKYIGWDAIEEDGNLAIK